MERTIFMRRAHGIRRAMGSFVYSLEMTRAIGRACPVSGREPDGVSVDRTSRGTSARGRVVRRFVRRFARIGARIETA